MKLILVFTILAATVSTGWGSYLNSKNSFRLKRNTKKFLFQPVSATHVTTPVLEMPVSTIQTQFLTP